MGTSRGGQLLAKHWGCQLAERFQAIEPVTDELGMSEEAGKLHKGATLVKHVKSSCQAWQRGCLPKGWQACSFDRLPWSILHHVFADALPDVSVRGACCGFVWVSDVRIRRGQSNGRTSLHFVKPFVRGGVCLY